MHSENPSIFDGWGRPFRGEIYEWAEQKIVLPSGVYAGFSGSFSVRQSRYLIEPFRALKDPRIRKVTAQFPIRSGKTLIGDIWLPYVIAERPGPFMWNMNTDTLARRHQRSRLVPLLSSIPEVDALMPSDPRLRNSQEIIFRNGMPFYIQTPSLDKLQGVMIRYLIEDELWLREAGRHEQAIGRLGDYEKIGASKQLNIGQGGIEDDDQDTEFKDGTQEEWLVPCLGCGKPFEPCSTGYRDDRSRYGLLWGSWEDAPKEKENPAMDARGNWIQSKVMETVRMVCPHCNHGHADMERAWRQWNAAGFYEVRNPKAIAHRSFHIYATITRSWKLLASQLAAALNAYRGGITEPRMIYHQKRDALPWSDAIAMDSTVGVRHALTSPESTPDDEAARIITVDHQEDGVNWALVVGITKTGELKRYAFKRCISDMDILALQDEWKVPARRVAIDAAWDSKTVYQWCVRHGWTALKGDSREFWIHLVGKKSNPRRVQRSYSKRVEADPEKGSVRAGQRFATLVHFSKPTMQDRFRTMLAKGKIIEPEVDPKDPTEITYRKQMRGQWRVMIKSKITGKVRFEYRDNGDDHARDCWNMAASVATQMKLLPDFESEGPEEGDAAEGLTHATG